MNASQLTSYRTVVLEGCDGAGKTTIASELDAEHGFTVVHSTRTPDHLDLTTRYGGILAKSGRIALDRCFLSELVYGPLYRGRSRLTWEQALDLSSAVVAREGVFVHLTGSPTAIHTRLRTRDNARAADLAVLTEIINAYDDVFTRLAAHVRVIRIDVSAGPPGPT